MIYIQNLSPREEGLALFAGRARRKRGDWIFEWYLFHRVGWNFSVTLDREDDTVLYVAIPWLLKLFLHLPPIGKPNWELGVKIHNQAIWLHLFSDTTGWNSKAPWWRSPLAWHFPWEWSWYSTEVLELRDPIIAKSVYTERAGDRKRLGIDSFEHMRLIEKASADHAGIHPYRYILKDGTVQDVQATIYAERMKWRMRWWWLLPFRKSRTSISVKFSDEVGEGRGSWKGGCVGCGYDLKLGETPYECLTRMERDRRFDR